MRKKTIKDVDIKNKSVTVSIFHKIELPNLDKIPKGG